MVKTFNSKEQLMHYGLQCGKLPPPLLAWAEEQTAEQLEAYLRAAPVHLYTGERIPEELN